MLELFKQYAIIVVSYFWVPPGRVVTHAEGGWVFKLAAECRETLGTLDSYQVCFVFIFFRIVLCGDSKVTAQGFF